MHNGQTGEGAPSAVDDLGLGICGLCIPEWGCDEDSFIAFNVDALSKMKGFLLSRGSHFPAVAFFFF